MHQNHTGGAFLVVNSKNRLDLRICQAQQAGFCGVRIEVLIGALTGGSLSEESDAFEPFEPKSIEQTELVRVVSVSIGFD